MSLEPTANSSDALIRPSENIEIAIEEECRNSDGLLGEQTENSDLRRAIQAIQNDPGCSIVEKAKRIQELMSANWLMKRPLSSVSINPSTKERRSEMKVDVTEQDKAATYHEKDVLGCTHYRRGCKKYAECCQAWFTCRFCHDDANDHQLDRYKTALMLCMNCWVAQSPAQVCSNADCQKTMARYYCDICKFWDDNEGKSIFHCEKCNLCRVGSHETVVHCVKCGVCLNRTFAPSHKCFERSLECDCPICGEYLFTTTSPVMFMQCGHAIHFSCHCEHIKNSYQCPICLKSIGDMSAYFRNLDEMMQTQRMPSEFSNVRAQILCNDCERKSIAPFHFVYHKCQHSCGSYNTKLLRTFTVDLHSTENLSGSGDIEAEAGFQRDSSSTSDLSILNRVDELHMEGDREAEHE